MLTNMLAHVSRAVSKNAFILWLLMQKNWLFTLFWNNVSKLVKNLLTKVCPQSFEMSSHIGYFAQWSSVRLLASLVYLMTFITHSSKLRSFCEHCVCILRKMFDVPDLPVLIFGNCVFIKTGVIKRYLKLYICFYVLLTLFSESRLLWISPCLPSGAKHNNGLGSPLPRVLVGD